LVRQIISSIRGLDLKEKVEEMTCHEESDWERLKKQLLNSFESYLPSVKYSRQGLKRLVNTSIQTGGIKTLEEFKAFRTKFESITNHLTEMGYTTSSEEFRELLLESPVSPSLESSVTRDQKMLASKDGGDNLLTYIQGSISISHAHKKAIQDEPNKEMANSPSAANPAPSFTPRAFPQVPKPTAPSNSGRLEQKVEELTRNFAALSAGK
jgi:hypothetical protein